MSIRWIVIRFFDYIAHTQNVLPQSLWMKLSKYCCFVCNNKLSSVGILVTSREQCWAVPELSLSWRKMFSFYLTSTIKWIHVLIYFPCFHKICHQLSVCMNDKNGKKIGFESWNELCWERLGPSSMDTHFQTMHLCCHAQVIPIACHSSAFFKAMYD